MPGKGLEMLARLGFAARGMVSLLVGLLALLGALGPPTGSDPRGSRGALQALLAQPMGKVVLGAIALGLFGFALWRILQALLDADGRGRAPKALAARAGQAISAASHVGLGVFALSLALGWGVSLGGGEEESARDWTRWLLAKPFGQGLVAAVGACFAGAGLVLLGKAWTGGFLRRLACDPGSERWIVPLGRAGHAARGLVFLVIGGFLALAAWQSDASEVRGLGGALLALQSQPFGQWLLAAVAAGLACFGAFGFAEARYRRISPPPEVARVLG